MKIKFFMDYRFMANPFPTGVAKHAYFMAKALEQDTRVSVSALVTSDQLGRQGCVDFLPVQRIGLPWKLSRELWTWVGHPVADRWVGDADWVYCPKNDWIPVKKSRYAVTIHGFHELDSNFVCAKGLKERLFCLRTRVQYLKMCERADVVFTVSQWLKEQIVEEFGIDEKKVIVVGNGVDECFYHAKTKADAIANSASSVPYIVCVGGLNHIDGGDRIIALAQQLQRNRKSCTIKVAGCQHDPGMERQALATGCVELLGHVMHDRLAVLMANAALLYYPTRYETFGMAAAEAMAAGCPVVTNRCTAVPEIVGDCGIYINPGSASEAMDAIMSLIEDGASRKQLISAAFLRSQQMKWSRCSAKMLSSLVSLR